MRSSGVPGPLRNSQGQALRRCCVVVAEVSVSVCVGGAVREPSDCGNSYYDKGSTGAGRLRVHCTMYMPTDCSENVPELTDCLSAVSAIVEEAGVESVFIIGDFNTHPGERFSKYITDFCLEQDWMCADMNKLGRNTFTFVSDAHGCRRWLDHCCH